MIPTYDCTKILRGVGFSLSAPKRWFIFYNSFPLRLAENLYKKKTFSQRMIYMFCLYHFSLKCIIKHFYLPLQKTNNRNQFFIICFYAIMHRTIVQNKIILIICSALFFLQLIFIGLVQGRWGQGRPNPKYQRSIFISEEEKDHSTQNCQHYNSTEPDFQF